MDLISFHCQDPNSWQRGSWATHLFPYLLPWVLYSISCKSWLSQPEAPILDPAMNPIGKITDEMRVRDLFKDYSLIKK